MQTGNLALLGNSVIALCYEYDPVVRPQGSFPSQPDMLIIQLAARYTSTWARDKTPRGALFNDCAYREACIQ